MGLDIGIGVLAGLRDDDPDTAEWVRYELEAINRVLASNGLPPHVEPERLPPLPDLPGLSGWPYTWLPYLRRAVAYALRCPEGFRVFRENEDPTEDEMYDCMLATSESHIICHSDFEGYYVPIDFPEPLFDDLPNGDPGRLAGGSLGSSQGGLQELVKTAPLLDIPLSAEGQLSDQELAAIADPSPDSHPHWIARQAWLGLYGAFRQSIEFRTAIRFG